MWCNTTTESQSRNSLLALLAGVGAGFVVGLAMAPKSGRKLRAELGDTADDYLDSASRKAADVQKSAANLAQQGLRNFRTTAGATSVKIKDMANGAVDTAHGALDTGISRGHEAISRGHEAIDRAADAIRSV